MKKGFLFLIVFLLILFVLAYYFGDSSFNFLRSTCSQNKQCINTCCGCLAGREKCDIYCESLPDRTCVCNEGKCTEVVTSPFYSELYDEHGCWIFDDSFGWDEQAQACLKKTDFDDNQKKAIRTVVDYLGYDGSSPFKAYQAKYLNCTGCYEVNLGGDNYYVIRNWTVMEIWEKYREFYHSYSFKKPIYYNTDPSLVFSYTFNENENITNALQIYNEKNLDKMVGSFSVIYYEGVVEDYKDYFNWIKNNLPETNNLESEKIKIGTLNGDKYIINNDEEIILQRSVEPRYDLVVIKMTSINQSSNNLIYFNILDSFYISDEYMEYFL